MELVAEDGSSVYVPQGRRKELGRGHGSAANDRTVSRCHVLLEFNNATHRDLKDKLSVKVQGRNPVCLVHAHEGGQEMVFLKKGEVDMLLPDDKISLSIVHPTFFTLKREYHAKDDNQEFGREPVPSMLYHHDAKCEVGIQSVGDSLKKPKVQIEQGNEAVNSDVRKIGEETGSYQFDSSNEEEALARAILRREKQGFERRQKQERIFQMREAGEASAHNGEVQDIKHEHGDIRHIDPVKEFGFLVEGQEFQQYARNFDGTERILPLQKTFPKDEAEEGDSDFESESFLTRNKLQNETEDDQVEKKSVSVDICRSSAKPSRRSQQPIKLKFTNKPVAFANNRDKTLGGFIIEDEEQEELSEEDDEDKGGEEDFLTENEETSEDKEKEDEGNNEDVNNQQRKKPVQEEQEKPFCKYGKSCYRKNKEHWAPYQH